MNNHFHLLLKQLAEKGVQKFLANTQNAYGKYFNLKNLRVGPVFQSRFKAKRIETEEMFLHVSRYIHLNPSTSYLVDIDRLDSYEWSSYPEYLGRKTPIFLNTEKILGMIGGRKKYEKFVLDQADYQRQLDKIKHLILED